MQRHKEEQETETGHMKTEKGPETERDEET